MRLDERRALAWRLRRHALDPAVAEPVAGIVDRVIAVRAWPAAGAEQAIRSRMAAPDREALARALTADEVIRVYAFRGGSYLVTPATLTDLLTCRRATRVWESERFQRQGGFRLDDWARLRAAVRDVLADGPATRETIGAHLARTPGLPDLTTAATGAGSDSLYKPLHWWGDICFGPDLDGRTTFRLRPDRVASTDLDEAGRRAVTAYLASYGPATVDNLRYWLTEGLSVPRRRVAGWLADLGDRVAPVEVAGRPALVLASDLADLEAAEPSPEAVLLPGVDPWVLGAGSADPGIVPPARRAVVTGGAGFVLVGGVVVATWRPAGSAVEVAWFPESGPAPDAALERAAARLAEVLGREHGGAVVRVASPG